MSSPAENARPAPVMTRHRIRSSFSISLRAVWNSSPILSFIAFNWSGRLRVILPRNRSSLQLLFRGWSFSLFPLSSFELGGPFVDECLHSFFHVLGGEEEVEVSSLELESLVESCLALFEDGVFCESSSDAFFVDDLASELLS